MKYVWISCKYHKKLEIHTQKMRRMYEVAVWQGLKGGTLTSAFVISQTFLIDQNNLVRKNRGRDPKDQVVVLNICRRLQHGLIICCRLKASFPRNSVSCRHSPGVGFQLLGPTDSLGSDSLKRTCQKIKKHTGAVFFFSPPSLLGTLDVRSKFIFYD